jgi:hypothetical protein
MWRTQGKTKNNMAVPFMFLGKGNYVKHEGEKPMSIIWEMEREFGTSSNNYF